MADCSIFASNSDCDRHFDDRIGVILLCGEIFVYEIVLHAEQCIFDVVRMCSGVVVILSDHFCGGVAYHLLLFL